MDLQKQHRKLENLSHVKLKIGRKIKRVIYKVKPFFFKPYLNNIETENHFFLLYKVCTLTLTTIKQLQALSPPPLLLSNYRGH